MIKVIKKLKHFLIGASCSLFSLILGACAPIPPDVYPSVRSSSVTLAKGAPPSGCISNGDIYATHEGGAENVERILQNAKNQLKNKAAAQGLNWVSMETFHTTSRHGNLVMVISGTGHRCPQHLVSAKQKSRELAAGMRAPASAAPRGRGPASVVPRKTAQENKLYLDREIQEEDIDKAIERYKTNQSLRESSLKELGE